MADLVAATAAVLALLCDHPAVVHVAGGTRFTDEIVAIDIRGFEDRGEVERLLKDAPSLMGHGAWSPYIMPISGGAGFTNDTLATRWSNFVMALPGANIYGTRMQQYSGRLMNNVHRREQEAWAAMDEEAKTQAVADKIALQRSRGRLDYGNCWTGPVSALTAEAQALTDGLEAMSGDVLVAAREMPGVINVETGFRANEYFSYVTVTPSADEDAVRRQLTAITGGEVRFDRFFYPTLSAAIRKASEAPVLEYNVPDTRFGDIDRVAIARQDETVWDHLGEMGQSTEIEREIAKRQHAGQVGFHANAW